MRSERCVDEEREGEEMNTFVSNWEGNLIVLRSFSSLSEKRRSWSADVPLKKPEERVKKREKEGKGGLASVCHGCKVKGGKVRSQQRCDIGKDRKVALPRLLVLSQYNSDRPDPLKMYLNNSLFQLGSIPPCPLPLHSSIALCPPRLLNPTTPQFLPTTGGSVIPP